MPALFETVSRIDRSAEISECEKYRWWLRRSWIIYRDGQPIVGKGVCCFVMLNPSTADAMQDDPTIRRCISFARAWGYDCLSVRNLFPWRATDPKELTKTVCDVSGGHRGKAELMSACSADLLVAAWGAGVPREMDKHVLALWDGCFPAKEIYCLGTTKAGHPKHPLYVKGDTLPQLFKPKGSPHA